jgi:hypothetical protein
LGGKFSNKNRTLAYPDLFTPLVVEADSGSIPVNTSGARRLQVSESVGRQEFPLIEVSAPTETQYKLRAFRSAAESTQEQREIYQANIWNVEEAQREELEEDMELKMEYAYASLLTDTNVITQNVTLSGTTQYTDQNNSTPVADFIAALTTIRDENLGLPPNRIVITHPTLTALSVHPEVQANFSLGRPVDRAVPLTPLEVLASLTKNFIVGASDMKLIIADGVYNTANLGKAEANQYIWGNDIVFLRREPSVSPNTNTVGLHLTKRGEGRKPPTRVRNFEDQNPIVGKPKGYTLLSMSRKMDNLLTDTSLAYLIKDAV